MNFKHAEKLLYSYLYNREILAQYLSLYESCDTDMHAHEYSDIHMHGVNDPVSGLLIRRENILNKIYSYKKRFEPVTLFLNALEKDSIERTIIEMIYFCKVSIKDLAKSLKINERTLYFHKQNLVKKFLKNLQKSA